MRDTKTTEFSAELKALLVENEIPLEPIEWRGMEEEADKIRKAHRHACQEIFRQVQRVDSPGYGMRISEDEDDRLKSNPENIAKLRDLVTALEEEDAKLQAALEGGVFAKAAEAQSAAWKRHDKMNTLYRSLKRDFERLQFEASHRFTQALKELRVRGFIAKQSGRVANLIEGVPAIWPDGSKSDWGWDFWYRGTHDTEGNLTPAGKALEVTFEGWGIEYEFTENGRRSPVLRVFLSRSERRPRPDIDLLNELGAALNYEEVTA